MEKQFSVCFSLNSPSDNEVYYESEPIVINVDTSLNTISPIPSPAVDKTLKESLIIGDRVDVRTVFQVPDDGMEYYIALNDVIKIYLGENTIIAVDNLHYENGKLSFTKTGHYIISVVSEAGISTGPQIDYDVVSKCWLLRWLDSLF